VNPGQVAGSVNPQITAHRKLEGSLPKHEAIGGLSVFSFGVVTVFLSLRMPIGTFRAAGSGLFPLCLGILLMVLAGLFLLKMFLQGRRSIGRTREAATPKAPSSARQVILFMGTIVLATLLFDVLGYPLVSFLLLVALLRVLGMKGWGWSIVLSLVAASVSYMLFVQWLKIPLPKGWLGI